MAASQETQRRLSRMRRQLAREFPEISEEELDGLVAATSGSLLSEARFEDFVPLLAHRFVRERLLADAEHEPAIAESRNGSLVAR
jgi:hypothetical protein